MPRRKPYTKVVKTNEVRSDRVRGMGDVVFRGFECLNPDCDQFIAIKENDLNVEDFEVKCPKCGYAHVSGGLSKFYDYQLVDTRNSNVIEAGAFSISHDDYLQEAHLFKFCIICNTLKPVDFFDRHSARASGRQGECRLCKAVYNSIKNQTRLTDQHREAAQKRRLYSILSRQKKIDSDAIMQRFGNKCFKCGRDLSGALKARDRPLDHTLPAVYLWPLTSENATLLCREHNAEKTGKWPSEFYTNQELNRLAPLTGLALNLLKGPPRFCPEAVERLKDVAFVDDLLAKYSAYMDEIIHLRNRILKATGLDFFKTSPHISPTWVATADERLQG